MARTRNHITIEDKIEKAQQKVVVTKEKYDAAVAELRKLYDKRDAMRKDELMNLFVKSNRSYEEVKAYLQAGVSETTGDSAIRGRRGRKKKAES